MCKLSRLLTCFNLPGFVLLLLLVSGTTATGDDTEIFISQNCEKYRFIFVVDNSGSMSSTEFVQSKSTIDAVISHVLDSSLEHVEVAVVQYGSNNAATDHTYNVTVGFTDDASTALAWSRDYGTGGTVNSSYYQDHTPASLASMRQDNVYGPGGALDVTDGTNVQFVFFTDALRDSSRWCCSSIVADSTNYIPSAVKPGFGEYNALKDGSVLPGGIKAQFTLLHVAPSDQAKAAGAAIASVGGSYAGAVESNTGDPDGSGATPRRYIEGSLASSDTTQIVNLVQEVIEEIQGETSFTAPALALDHFSRINHRKDIYFALFSPVDKPVWEGNLKRYEFGGSPAEIRDQNNAPAVDPDTGSFFETAQSYWSLSADGSIVESGGVAALLDSSNRHVSTYLGTTPELLATDNKLHEDNASVTSAMLGVSDSERQALLQWSRGVDVLDENGNGSSVDSRKHIGDPLHSSPTLVTYGGTTNNPDSVIYFGTNEGYLHAINSADGAEVFSFVPSDLLPNLSSYYGATQNTGASADNSTIYLENQSNSQKLNATTASSIQTSSSAEVWKLNVVGRYWNYYDIVTIQHVDSGQYLRRNGSSVITSGTTNSSAQWVVQNMSDGSQQYYSYDGSWWRLFVDGSGTVKTGTGSGAAYRWHTRAVPAPTLTLKDKLYGLDGEITLWTEDKNNNGIIEASLGDHAYLYIGQRRGGRHYYALDVTVKDNPRFLWSIEGGTGSYTELGQTWSKPVLSTVHIGSSSTEVLVFGGGYDPAQDDVTVRTNDSIGRGVFIVDALTGALLWHGGPDIAATEQFGQMNYSMPATPKVLDLDTDGYADQIYIGDMGGQVWRFDVNRYASTNADLVKGGVIANLADDTAAGNRRFFSTPDATIVALDGHFYLYLAIGSGNRAHPLDTVIEDRFYVMRLSDYQKVPDGYGMEASPATHRPITESDLFDVTDNIISEGNETERTEAEAELASLQGWYLDFDGSGEKSLSPSITANYQLLFTTYVPTIASHACTASVGAGLLYALNIMDGTPAVAFSDDETDPSTPLTASNRSRQLKRGGIPTTPFAYFPQDEPPQIMVGPEKIPEIGIGGLVKRVYWSELPDF